MTSASVTRSCECSSMYASTSPLLDNVKQIIEVAAELGLPTLYSTCSPVLFGGLMSYGPHVSAIRESLQ